jgi:uncharacterized protein YndB with AHSA1/START domain
MLAPIRKSIVVAWDQQRSFERFTKDIATWWPLRTHSVGGDRAVGVVFEERVGGRIIEKIEGGEESVWGTIETWDPPRRLSFTWHPGDEPEKATFIEVTFEPIISGTRLELVHSRWENLGALAKTAQRGYPIGWAYVLRLWADRRSSPVVRLIDFLSPLTDFLQRRMKAKLDREAAAAKARA